MKNLHILAMALLGAYAALLSLGHPWPSVAALGLALLAGVAQAVLDGVLAWRAAIEAKANGERMAALEALLGEQEKRLQAVEGRAALNSVGLGA